MYRKMSYVAMLLLLYYVVDVGVIVFYLDCLALGCSPSTMEVNPPTDGPCTSSNRSRTKIHDSSIESRGWDQKVNISCVYGQSLTECM